MEIRNKTFVLIFAFILLLSDVSAIRINEVEVNPPGDERTLKNEWIELYNDEDIEINISRWIINDSIKKRHTIPNETFMQSKSYYIINLNGAILNNNEEDLVILYDNYGNKINEMITLKDEQDNDLTHQFCSPLWKFRSSTKGSENNCSEEIQEPQTTQNSTLEEETTENLTTSQQTIASQNKQEGGTYNPKATTKTIILDAIELNSKDIKSEENKEILKKNLALAGIVSFCLGFGALFLIKTLRKKNQNEFR